MITKWNKTKYEAGKVNIDVPNVCNNCDGIRHWIQTISDGWGLPNGISFLTNHESQTEDIWVFCDVYGISLTGEDIKKGFYRKNRHGFIRRALIRCHFSDCGTQWQRSVARITLPSSELRASIPDFLLPVIRFPVDSIGRKSISLR